MNKKPQRTTGRVYQSTIELVTDLRPDQLARLEGIQHGLVDGLLGDPSIIRGLTKVRRDRTLTDLPEAIDAWTTDPGLSQEVTQLIATRLHASLTLNLPQLLWFRWWYDRHGHGHTFGTTVTMGDKAYRDAIRALLTADSETVKNPDGYPHWIKAWLRTHAQRMPKATKDRRTLIRRHAKWWYTVRVQQRSQNQLAKQEGAARGTIHHGIENIPTQLAVLKFSVLKPA
jgi:hypothetical protein